MRRGIFHQLLFVLVIQLSVRGLHSKLHATAKSPTCPSIGVPIRGQRGSNIIHGTKPLYKLDMEEAARGFGPGNTYQIYIKAQDPDRKFTDVLLTMQTDSPKCGDGSFVLDSELHGQPDNCSHMVYKMTRTQEHIVSFTWTAPQCGCVDFRARVKSATGLYYMDDDDTQKSFLSKKVCSTDLTTLVSELPRSKRINILCAISQDTSSSPLTKRPDVLKRRNINIRDMSLLKMEDLKINLYRRSDEVRECCSKSGEEQHECFGDIRRLRIDQFCEDGEPVIPFTVSRHDYMRKRQEECCWKLGERRYSCFAAPTSPGGRSNTGLQADWVKTTNIMDESDPLNDVEDYPAELSQQLNEMHILPVVKAKTKTDVNKDPIRKSVPVRRQHRIPKTRLKSADDTTLGNQGDTRTHRRVKTGSNTDDTTTVQPRIATNVTPTTEELFHAFQMAQASYQCCNAGKQRGLEFEKGDYWRHCEKSARRHAKSHYKKGRGKCRRYYHQCCVEQVQLLETTSNRMLATQSIPQSSSSQLTSSSQGTPIPVEPVEGAPSVSVIPAVRVTSVVEGVPISVTGAPREITPDKSDKTQQISNTFEEQSMEKSGDVPKNVADPEQKDVDDDNESNENNKDDDNGDNDRENEGDDTDNVRDSDQEDNVNDDHENADETEQHEQIDNVRDNENSETRDSQMNVDSENRRLADESVISTLSDNTQTNLSTVPTSDSHVSSSGGSSERKRKRNRRRRRRKHRKNRKNKSKN